MVVILAAIGASIAYVIVDAFFEAFLPAMTNALRDGIVSASTSMGIYGVGHKIGGKLGLSSGDARFDSEPSWYIDEHGAMQMRPRSEFTPAQISIPNPGFGTGFGGTGGGLGSFTETSQIGSRDSGGPGIAGQGYLIGTGAQPELFIPKSSGYFFPNADKLISRDDGGPTTPAPGNSPPESLLKQIVSMWGSNVDELLHGGSGFVHDTGRHIITNAHVISSLEELGMDEFIAQTAKGADIQLRLLGKYSRNLIDLDVLEIVDAADRAVLQPSNYALNKPIETDQILAHITSAYSIPNFLGLSKAANVLDDYHPDEQLMPVFEYVLEEWNKSLYPPQLGDHRMMYAPLGPGASGSAVFDAATSQVVGMNTWGASEWGESVMGAATGGDFVKHMADAMIEGSMDAVRTALEKASGYVEYQQFVDEFMPENELLERSARIFDGMEYMIDNFNSEVSSDAEIMLQTFEEKANAYAGIVRGLYLETIAAVSRKKFSLTTPPNENILTAFTSPLEAYPPELFVPNSSVPFTTSPLSSMNAFTMDSGGPGAAGLPYLIGRRAQPELFVPNSAGQFYPNADKMMQQGNTYQVTINAQIPAGADADAYGNQKGRCVQTTSG